MSDLRILLGVHHFPPGFTGGAEWRAHRTAKALAARGASVRVICVERPDSGAAGKVTWEDEVYDGVEVRRLSYDIRSAPDPFRWSYDNPWIAEHLRDLLRDWRPDVFHLIGGYLLSGRALRTAREAGVPTVVTLTDFWFLCPRISMWRSDGRLSTLPIRAATCARCLGEERRRYRLPGRWFPGLMRRYWDRRAGAAQRVEDRLTFLRDTLNRTDAIICPSRFLLSVFSEAGIEAGRLVYSRQGRELPAVVTPTAPKTPGAVLRLGYLGQLTEIKGVHVLFEAARLLPGAAFTLRAHGDPAPHPSYVARLRALAGADRRLQLAGAYRHGTETLRAVFSEVDAVVVPSLWYENSPNVILEALAHRTPVIASNLGGMAELVEHERNGLLFAPGDAADLARQIRRLITEPDLLPRLRSGIGPIKTIDEEMAELTAIYRRVTDDSEARPSSS